MGYRVPQGNDDMESWSLPKSERNEGEDAKEAAIREFEEETGSRLDVNNLIELNGGSRQGWYYCFIENDDDFEKKLEDQMHETIQAKFWGISEALRKIETNSQRTVLKGIQTILSKWEVESPSHSIDDLPEIFAKNLVVEEK
jgi:hypothetical protein